MKTDLERQLEGSVKIKEQEKMIIAQANEITFLRAQIDFLEIKILRLTTPPARMVG